MAGQLIRSSLCLVLGTVALSTQAADAPPPAAVVAAQVQSFSPGEQARSVRQAAARFNVAMVTLGDPMQADPFVVDCAAAGTGRWVDTRNWVYDFAQPVPPGLTCTFTLRKSLRAANGAQITGQQQFAFSSGAPAITAVLPQPSQWQLIDEDQLFLVRFDAPVTPVSLSMAGSCAVAGIGEPLAIDVLQGEPREAVLRNRRALGWDYRRLLQGDDLQSEPLPTGDTLAKLEANIAVLRCQRALPPEAKVTLRIGQGVQGTTGVAGTMARTFEFKVRPAFTARVECERSNATAGCLPMQPIVVQFSATVPARWADAVRLRLADGRELQPTEGDAQGRGGRDRVIFKGPFPQQTTVSVVLPQGLRDDAERPLINAARFPLQLAVDEMPPLVKFAADFGILEADEGGVLPVTVRNVEPGLTGTQAELPAKLLQLDQNPQQIIQWLKRVEAAGQSRGSTDAKSQQWREQTGDRSVFAGAEPTRSFKLAQGSGDKAFEVVGIPLRNKGFYVVELQSRLLGQALLGRDQLRYVATAALVTDLAVHFKWGRESSLVWVTRLSTGLPVADAAVAITGWCDETQLWQGRTNKDGIAQIYRTLGVQSSSTWCGSRFNHDSQAVMVSAATADDLGFVLSSWDQGISPYQFSLTTGSPGQSDLAHTVTDRSLLHPGEQISMKHYLRRTASEGVLVADGVAGRRAVQLVHAGSGDTVTLQADFDAGGIAESAWQIPTQAHLGVWNIFIEQGNERHYSGEFKVEEFRLPLMRASVSGSATPLVGMKSAQLDMQVGYLSGGGAGNLAVRLRSLVQPAPVSFKDLPNYQFGGEPVVEGISHDDDAPSPDTPDASSHITRVQPLTLDASGGLRVQVGDLPAVKVPSQLLAELEYADPNGELQTTRTRVTLLPSALHVGVSTPRWASSQSQLKFTVALRDLDGKPVAGRNAQVALYHAQRFSFRKRLVGGFYAYQTTRETRRIEPHCEGVSDTRGLLVCNVDVAVTGEVLLRAEAQDDSGRTAGATASMWVFNGGEAWFGGTSGDRMDLLPEREEWEAGQKARLQVRMPFRAATALVTVERQGVLSGFVTHLDGRDPLLEVPLAASYAPNVYVSVLAVRGRVPADKAASEREVTALVDLNKPAMRLGMAALKVGWKPHRLDVTVEVPKPVWRVRDKVPVNIHVQRADGSALPAGAEVAVAAIDAALLELAPNDSWKLLDAMMQERGIEVFTSSAQQQVVGNRHYGRKAVASGGGGGRDRGRELFDSLLLWKGRLALDAKGNATVTVPLNDSLSEFRIVAIANAGVGLFGTGQAKLNTTQDLMLLSGLPPLVREGDEFLATLTVRNASQRRIVAQLTGSKQPEGSAFAAQPLSLQTVDLAPGQSRNIAWRVKANNNATALRWDITAREQDGAQLDRLQVRQQVREAVKVQVQQATLQQLDAALSVPLALPASALPGKGGVQVKVQARLADNLVGVRTWLARYPYDCLEQRVSRAVGQGDNQAWQALQPLLGSYTDRDGLLRYYPSELIPGDDVLTAYVITIVSEAGWQIPQPQLDRMRQALQRFVLGQLQRSSPLQTADLSIRKLAAIDALAHLGEVDAALLDSIALEPQTWPTSALLDWIDLLQRMPGLPQSAQRKAQALQLLRDKLDLSGTTLRFSLQRRDVLPWLMVSADSIASRILLTALQQPQWRDDVPRLVKALLDRQQQGSWSTTVGNAWGAVAVARFSQQFETVPVSGNTALQLGAQRSSIDWQQAASAREQSFAWPTTPGTLQVSHTGTGKPWISLTASAAVPRTLPIAAGFVVQRSVTALEQRKPGVWSRGDLVRVRLDMEARADNTWVVVDDPVPAGASLLGSESATLAATPANTPARRGRAWLAFEERRFEGLRAYYRFVPRGTWTLEYTLRLNNPGTFNLPATRIEAMYAPEQFAELPQAAWRVEP